MGSMTPWAYRTDETNIDWTVPHLREFLLQIAQQSGAEHINLIAHSMGNRILTNAIEAMIADLKDQTKPTFGQVILTAPDIDAEVFRDALVPSISKISDRLTLYASSNDKALQLSRALHGNYPRAGDSGPNIVVCAGLDSVDASPVDTYFLSTGHSYFGDNRSIISDLYLLMRDGSAPDRRNLLPEMEGKMPYWLFRP